MNTQLSEFMKLLQELRRRVQILLGSYFPVNPVPLMTYQTLSRGRARRLIERYDLIQSALVAVLVLIILTLAELPGVGLAASAIYAVIVIGHRSLLQKNSTREWANSEQGFLIRALLLTSLNSVFIFLLYAGTPYLEHVKNQDTLWLLYILANHNLARRGRPRILFFNTAIAIFGLALSVFWQSIRVNEGGINDFLQVMSIRSLWLVTLTILLYSALHFLGDTTGWFNLVRTVAQSLPTTAKVKELAQSAVESVRLHFGFDHIHIFIGSSEGLKIVAASSPEGQQLLSLNFVLSPNEPSLNYLAYETGGPIRVNDIEVESLGKQYYYRHPIIHDIRSEMVIPLKEVGGQVIGTLDIQDRSPNQFLPEDEDIMITVADSLGPALANALTTIEIQERAASITRLQEVAMKLSQMPFSVTALDDVLKTIATYGKQVSSADIVILYELSSGGTGQVRRGPFVAGELNVSPLHLPKHKDNVIFRLAPLGEALFADDVFAQEHVHLLGSVETNGTIDEQGFRMREKVASLAVLPLRVESGGSASQDLIGLVFFNYRKQQRFGNDPTRKQFMQTFADMAALAIQKSRLFENEIVADREKRWDQVYHRIVSRLDWLNGQLREMQTEGHAKDVLQTLAEMDWEITELKSELRLEEPRTSGALKRGLFVSLQNLQRRLSRMFERKYFEFDLPQEELPLSKEVSDAILYIVEESITNALKHAKAQSIWVHAFVEDGRLTVGIENDGPGFDKSTLRERRGLIYIEDRVHQLEGDLDIESREGKDGTLLTVTIPLSKPSILAENIGI